MGKCRTHSDREKEREREGSGVAPPASGEVSTSVEFQKSRGERFGSIRKITFLGMKAELCKLREELQSIKPEGS
jgi:hypothetical protein